MYTVSVNLAGYDGVFYYFGEGQITNYDGTVLVQGQRNPYEIITGEIHPCLYHILIDIFNIAFFNPYIHECLQ